MFRRDRDNPTGDVRSLGLTPDEAVDALLDREIAPADLPTALALIASDPAASARLERMRSMFDDLRAPVEAPDLSRRVLGEVGRRRRWMTPGLQHVVTAGRLALAASLLATVATTLVLERMHPDAAVFGGPEATPLASVVDAGRQEARLGLEQVGGLLDRSFPGAGAEGQGMFLLGTLEPLDAAGRLMRLSPVPASAPTVWAVSSTEGVPVDLTGRDCTWGTRTAPAPAEAASSEETRWVLLPRGR
ncbi:MAG: hypothetical protein ACF8QF_08875 [Phycisphaerales bacterium]